MVDKMEILYKDDELEIQSYDFITENDCEMIDFLYFIKGLDIAVLLFVYRI